VPLPLEGIRVIDITVVWAGPFASCILGDLGAEVIRVESIQRWDTLSRGPSLSLEAVRAHRGEVDPATKPWDLSRDWSTMGRNKKSMTVDLTRPEGREVFYRLVAKSDVFIENNSADVVRRLGISYDILSKHNPRLIMMSMPAFGNTGPYRHYRGYGANMEAVMGHALLRGYADRDPTHNSVVLFSDAASGATGAFAVQAALYHRLKTGKGQFIDLAQAEAVAGTYSQAYMDYAMNRRVQHTIDNRDPSRAPQGVYRCRGGDNWIAVSCGDDKEFRSLCDVMDRPELKEDERFANVSRRYRNQDELDSEISSWTADLDMFEAFHALQLAGVPSGPVQNAADVLDDPHLRERGVWQEVTTERTGKRLHLKPVLGKMSKTPLAIRSAPPTLGHDNAYIYKDILGYSEDEYRWFIETDHAGETFIFDRDP
jgi:crotonobetainyl-CoA:carnitine CoA-transferase CaiB-like acyl-CoA transferase